MKKLIRGLTTQNSIDFVELIGIFFFWAAFLFEVVYLIFRKSDFFLPQEAYWLAGLIGCYLIKIICTRYSKGEWIAIAVAMVIGTAAYLTAHNMDYLQALLFVAASKGIKRDTALRLVGMSLYCMTALLVVRCLIGVQGKLFDSGDFGRGIEEIRYRFGFSHANQLHYAVFCMMAIYLVVKRGSLTWQHYFLLLVTNTAVLYLTRSRTGALICYLIIIGNMMIQYWRRLHEYSWIYLLGYIALAGVVGIALLGRFVDTGRYSLLTKLDDVLTGRMNLAYSTSPRPLELFSNRSGGTTDMGLVMQANSQGIAMTILFIVAIVGLIHELSREREGYEYVLLMATLLYVLTENQQAMLGWASQSFVILLLIDRWYRLFGIRGEGKKAHLWQMGKVVSG
ncbi:MAG: hypothetical protein Q4B72_12405 [Lachnospiraceae bacterium]|nr:hypothetical protein [Lachnospiraceae bacterium]